MRHLKLRDSEVRETRPTCFHRNKSKFFILKGRQCCRISRLLLFFPSVQTRSTKNKLRKPSIPDMFLIAIEFSIRNMVRLKWLPQQVMMLTALTLDEVPKCGNEMGDCLSHRDKR